MSTNPTAPLPSATWTAPEADLVIEYSLEALDQIRLYTVEGLKQLSRGGIEVGGILFGTRGDDLVRISAWRPIACEHAKGAGFLLSQTDRIALGKFLQDAKSEPGLENLHAVGWFVSHTRAGVRMTDADLKVYNHYFPWSWQITLVVQPAKDGVANAGFFFRDANGTVNADVSHREFVLTPGVLTQPSPPIPEHPAALPLARNEVKLPPTPPSYRPPAPLAASGIAHQRLWIWTVPLLLALLVGGMVLERPGGHSTTPGLGFHAVDSGGELHFEWDKSAEVIRDAVRATLDIKDGDATIQIPLTVDRLREGTLAYSRKSGDLDAQMTVYPVNGTAVQESARFVGPTANNPKLDEATALRHERDALVAEIDQLKETLRRTQVRNRELEDAVRILENRVQVEKQHLRRKPE